MTAGAAGPRCCPQPFAADGGAASQVQIAARHVLLMEAFIDASCEYEEAGERPASSTPCAAGPRPNVRSASTGPSSSASPSCEPKSGGARRRVHDRERNPARPRRQVLPGHAITRQQRARAIYPAHALVHRGGMSIRQAQKAMLETYQIRRSAGTIADDLARCDVPPGCPGCPP